MKYPLGIQTFEKIRDEDYVYIDKTALIYELINTGSVYFLSRPRRFGKSLLLSTLEALFSGQKALFEGLAIADTDYDFATYAIVNMEFSKVKVQSAEDIARYINTCVNQHAAKYDVTIEAEGFELRFDELIQKVAVKTKTKVVLLIDEYDKPILDNLLEDALPEIKRALNGFYSVVKALDKSLRFTFITGVSKFAKISVFSGMNNLTDISNDIEYATLCGITQQELETELSQGLIELAEMEQLDHSKLLQKVKHWYNGYRFHYRAEGVYNPYSVLSVCKVREFRHFWFTTATPTFLIDLIKARQFNLTEIENFELDDSAFSSMEPEQISPILVLLQAGYLTIAGFEDELYTLDFPNFEVKYAFYRSVIQQFGHTEVGVNTKQILELKKALVKDDIEQFFNIMKTFFANIPYGISLKDEKYYQSLFFAILTMLGYKIEVEVQTNIGRIDCVLQTNNTVYVIEFKLHDSKEAALKQIQTKQYAQKYLTSEKRVVLLGVEFDQATRNIGEYLRLDI